MENQQSKIEQCTPMFRPTNRAEKRIMCFEYEKVFTPLWEVEQNFYVDLFDSIHDDYEALYLYYLELYNKTVDFIKKTRRLKYWELNEYYFEKLFKPIPNA